MRSARTHRVWSALATLLLAVAAEAEMAITRVVEVNSANGSTEVVLEAGQTEGLRPGMEVALLREKQAIVHPLTGEVLGTPQEPVGMAQVQVVEMRRTWAVMLKTYSAPQVGDQVEYQTAPPVEPAASRQEAPREMEPAPPPQADPQVVARLRELEEEVASYQKAQKTVSAYPVFAQQVWNEMRSIKSYLVTLDERLVALEARQSENNNRLTSVLSGEYRNPDAKELTIRYDPQTDIKLSVAGKILTISVERDTLSLQEPVAGAMALPAMEEEEEKEKEQEEEETSFALPGELWDSPILMGGSLVLAAVLAGVVLWVIKRRYDDVMEGMDEFDEEYLDEDEDEDEEEEK